MNEPPSELVDIIADNLAGWVEPLSDALAASHEVANALLSHREETLRALGYERLTDIFPGDYRDYPENWWRPFDAPSPVTGEPT